MPSAASLLKALARSARLLHDCTGAPGCLIGPNVITAVSVEARVGPRKLKQEAGEGGFEFTQPPSANILKEGNARPQQDWCFYDGEKWWLIDDVQTTDTSAEWKLILKPLSNTPS